MDHIYAHAHQTPVILARACVRVHSTRPHAISSTDVRGPHLRLRASSAHAQSFAVLFVRRCLRALPHRHTKRARAPARASSSTHAHARTRAPAHAQTRAPSHARTQTREHSYPFHRVRRARACAFIAASSPARTRAQARINACARKRTRLIVHAHAYARDRARAHARAQTRASVHERAYAHVRACAHAHERTRAFQNSPCVLFVVRSFPNTHSIARSLLSHAYLLTCTQAH